jgi:hypothetical protein
MLASMCPPEGSNDRDAQRTLMVSLISTPTAGLPSIERDMFGS